MRHVLGIALATSVLFGVGAQALAQDAEGEKPEKPPVITIPLPDDLEIDEEVLEAIQKGFKEEKARFIQTLIDLQAQSIDYTRDDPRKILEKQRAARLAFQRRAVNRGLMNLDRSALMLNVVQVRNATAPRLSGRVLKVGENEKFATIDAALAKLKSGDQIVLSAGQHVWPRARARRLLPSDVAIVGQARDSILIFQSIPIAGGLRLRLRGLTIEYPGRPFYQARNNSSLELIDCALNNTMGRGYAMYGSDAIVYVEGCVFDGDSSGRRPRSSASVFRLYRDSILYVRRSRFRHYHNNLGNGQTGTVFEQVEVDGETPAQAARQLSGRNIFVRDNRCRGKAGPVVGAGAESFQRATDDPELVGAAAGGDADVLDDESRRLLRVLALERNLPYWIGLLRHDNEALRTIAAERVEALSDQTVQLGAEHLAEQDERLKQLIRRLDSPVFHEREAASAALKALGEAARQILEDTRRNGSLEQQARADAILSELDAADLSPHENEWMRLMRWFENNREQLRWDKDLERYRLDKDE